MELEVYKKDGTKSGETVTLAPEVFEITPNDHAIYQAVRSIQANKRQGTHKVKGRSEVSGGGKKPFKQKKTGRARSGSSRSGVWVGGGSIFGPKPHDYVIKLSAKVRALARRSALSYKAKDNSIVVVEDFSLEAPKTKELMIVLKALSIYGKKTLLLTTKNEEGIYKSGRNIPSINVREAGKASTYDILDTQVLLIQKSAVEVLQKSLTN
ncbi:MAG: 50S ribosomal protein L4 [Ignavibacteriales bacterium]|nr:50S ribosomal protein L4 [Ignavibacteriales bacterium]